MKRILKRVAGVLLVLLVGFFAVIAVLIGRTDACTKGPAATDPAHAMKAVVRRCYGGPEVLQLEEVDKPIASDHDLIIKVHAAALNPLDWHYMEGSPYVMRLDTGTGAPKDARVGVDFAGVVESVGKSVTRFKVGDEVFGGRTGALAEYVRISDEGAMALKPENVSFEAAAATPIAGITALQGLRDGAHVKSGQSVLINGASGGVGTFAVQIAKSMGASVTGVSSGKSNPLVQLLGADHVIDYTREDFTKSGVRYDVIFDTVVNKPLLEYRAALKPGAIFILIGGGGPHDDPWVGPFSNMIKAVFINPFVDTKYHFFLADLNSQDLAVLADMMKAGTVKPAIDRTYPLAQSSEAMAYLETGHAHGKVVVTMP
jgi:NADPH:quinone reductase-like Zn-dependent oxidoreductase